MKIIWTVVVTASLLSGTAVFAQNTASTDTNTMGGSSTSHHKHKKSKKSTATTPGSTTGAGEGTSTK